MAKRAAAKGHHCETQAVPNGPLEATLDFLAATDFSAGADFVLVNSLQPAALMAACNSGRRVAVRLIDSYASASPQALAEVQRLALMADLILVPTQYLLAVVKGWGVNASVRVVPYAYDQIRAQQIAVVTARAARPDGFPLAACQPLNEATRSSLETFFLAMARLRLDWHLNLIGAGPALPGLKAKAKQLLIEDRITFLGRMPHDKTMEYFRAAKAYVDPYGLDGFPTMALYAMAEGCPVIAARTGPVLELVEDHKNGLLFSGGEAQALAEAVVTLSSVQGLALQLISQAVRTVELHSWNSTVNAVFSGLESLE